MTGWLPVTRTRDLPLFFITDISEAMRGTFEVTLQTGLLSLGEEFERRTSAVTMRVITCEQKAALYTLPPPAAKPLNLHAHDQCRLKPALEMLSRTLESDVVVDRAEELGSHRPLVFLILGSRPVDQWHSALGPLVTLTSNRRPVFITLVLHDQPDLVNEMMMMSSPVLALQVAEAEYITHFFSWASRTIISTLESFNHGRFSLVLPRLPIRIIIKG